MATLIEPLQRHVPHVQTRRRGRGAPLIDRLSVHLGRMFSDEPLEQRLRSAAEWGFSYAEHPEPFEVSAARMRVLLGETGLQMARISLPLSARGEKGLACLPGRDAEFRDTVERGTDYAAEIGCGMVHMPAGVVQADQERRDLWPIYIERLQFAAEAAARRCQTLLVEPIGVATHPNYFLDDPYAGLRAIDSVTARNVSLLFDVFHASNAGVDAVRFASRHMADIAHIHIADFPGRHEPGTGVFQFGKLFGALDAAGYQGLIGLEYAPAGDTRTGLSWIDAYDF